MNKESRLAPGRTHTIPHGKITGSFWEIILAKTLTINVNDKQKKFFPRELKRPPKIPLGLLSLSTIERFKPTTS